MAKQKLHAFYTLLYYAIVGYLILTLITWCIGVSITDIPVKKRPGVVFLSSGIFFIILIIGEFHERTQGLRADFIDILLGDK